MVDKDGKVVKKVKPILIKKEIERNYATLEQFEKHVREMSFTDEARVAYREVPPLHMMKKSLMMRITEMMMKFSV